MLMGEYNHTLDAKGRIIIPVKLREQLGDNFVVSKGLDGCLFAFPSGEWEKLVNKLQALPLTDKNARKFSRYLLAGASEAELDKQGRALLPQTLREAADLVKDVVLCGVGNRLEIWSKEAWTKESHYEDIDELAEMMADLGI
ncbi:MAG: division/cell wall cluster transcriptional repressor MraZ [Lachnospiraceae bacterium]|jgi:MraZ protein|nr:division/cell wall cluster transcriptional repressor MraZ [Lachnospiraceae bacterium]